MSQISQPVRFVLIGAVVFCVAWFMFLRPKSEPDVPALTTSTTTTPVSTPQTGLGRAVESARKAGETTPVPSTTPAAGTKATTSAPDVKAKPAPIAAVPATELAKLPAGVAAALTARKVLVLGVLSQDATPLRPLADDDRYVRNALAKVNRYDGAVVVKPVALDKLSGYAPLVNDLDVTQSPAIVVIDRDLKGTVLTGYVDTVAINQVIADARRDSIQPHINDAYLSKANSICSGLNNDVARWSQPTIRGKPARLSSYRRAQAIIRENRLAITRLRAPAKYKRFKAAFVKVMNSEQKRVDAIARTGQSKAQVDVFAADAVTDSAAWRAFDRQANAAGATACAVNRAK